MKEISNSKLGKIGTVSAAIASYFLVPFPHSIGAAIFVFLFAGLILFLKGRWVVSNADQWLLVIRDGKLHKSGIGLKTLTGMADTIVRFPSKVERVDFQANNVTQEMQGVEIKGFAFWSVYREDDGPFRCYKYMEGNNANANVQAMCESVLRSLIANSSLDDVLRNRNHLRDSIKSELKDQFKGWGVWLETVEIIQVKISSNRLFTDLQAEFRQKTHLKAQQILLGSNEKIQQVRQASDMKRKQLRDDNKTRKQKTKNQEALKRQVMEQEYQLQKNVIELKSMQREKKLYLEQVKNRHVVNELKEKNKQEIVKMNQDFDNSQKNKEFQIDRLHNDTTLEKYKIDSMERTYASLGLRNISIHKYSGGDKETLAAVFPALGYGLAQAKDA